MINFGKEVKTKNGEYITPLLEEGSYILCADRTGKSIYKKSSELDTPQTAKNKNIVAVPKKKIVKKEVIETIYNEPTYIEEPKYIDPIKEIVETKKEIIVAEIYTE